MIFDEICLNNGEGIETNLNDCSMNVVKTLLYNTTNFWSCIKESFEGDQDLINDNILLREDFQLYKDEKV